MSFVGSFKRKLFGNTTNDANDNNDTNDTAGDNGNTGIDTKRSKITLNDNIETIKKQCEKGTIAKLDTCTLLNDNLKTFALIQTILEIYDADHDLNRSKYDKNPLVEYCKSFEKFPKFIFINNNIIDLNDYDLEYIHRDNNWSSTSQSAIKKNMENILKGLDTKFLSTFGRIPFTSSITSENKQLTDLQVSLKTKNIDLTLVETHRGGEPDNSVQEISIMLKGSASTIFDLGSNAIPIIENRDIQPGFCGLDNNDNVYNFENQPMYTETNKKPNSPLCRFFSNYFPNSFTIVIKNTELTKDGLNGIFNIMGDYFGKFGLIPKTVVEDLHEQIYAKTSKHPHFFSNRDDTYLLHMFMDLHMFRDSAKYEPTFSIQKGPITADQVTNELYGVRHRCFSSKTRIKPIEETLLILDNNITPNVRFCHILYAKTCGDGIAIEIVKILSKLFRITVNLLSNDVCCNYRNVFVNGFSTRQAPSSLAGTLLGRLSTKRNVEIMTMINPTTTTLSDCIQGIINEFYTNQNDIEPYYYDDKKTVDEKTVDEITKENDYFGTVGINGFDDDALKDILTCAYRKIYIDEYNDDTKAKQTQIIELIKNLNGVENLEINDENCELLKELCANRQLLFIKKKVDNSFENFKNRLKNILKKIQEDYPALIQTRVSGDDDDKIAFTIERGISLVSSLEQLLGEVYPFNNDELGLKKLVLYFLTVVIQKSISATRIIGRYIDMLKRRLIEIINVQLTKGKTSIRIRQLDSNSSYEDFLTVFNILFNNFTFNYQNDDDELKRYNRRQQAKQPLNLLKFILRSIEANNKWINNKLINPDDNDNLYQYIKKNYYNIITDSNAASPQATQDINSLSQQIYSYRESYGQSNQANEDIITEATAATEKEIITHETAAEEEEIMTDEKAAAAEAKELENKIEELENKIEELENSDLNIFKKGNKHKTT